MKWKKIMTIRRFSLFVLLLYAFQSQGAMETKFEKVRKSFAYKTNTTLEISNRYGKVVLRAGGDDSIRFDITMVARNKSMDKVQESLSNVEVRFNATENSVLAETVFSSDGTSLMMNLNKWTDKALNTNLSSSLEINYTVYIPSSANVKISNAFGDVLIDEWKGNLGVELSHGDIKMASCQGYATFNLKFGDLKVQNLKRAGLTLEFANAFIFSIENGDFNTKSSKINVQNVQRMRCRSKRDDYTIYKAKEISFDAQYSDFVLTSLSDNLMINSKYGDFTVQEISPTFKRISINSENSSVNLNFSKECSFDLDVHLVKGDFNYPASFTQITKKSENMAEEEKLYFGRVGKNAGSESIFEVLGNNTFIQLSNF